LVFKNYAEIDSSVFQLNEDSKNPFVRFDLDSALKVPVEALAWKQVGKRTRQWSFSEEGQHSRPSETLTIQEAKRLLASSLGVRPDQIEITIRG